MRAIHVTLAALALLASAAPTMAASCRAQIPEAQRFVANLHDGPNTRAAQRHLDAASRSYTERECADHLRQVDTYARRSAAADRRSGVHRRTASGSSVAPRIECADTFHQNRPGGSDYHGPRVAGCAR